MHTKSSFETEKLTFNSTIMEVNMNQLMSRRVTLSRTEKYHTLVMHDLYLWLEVYQRRRDICT